MKRYFLSRDEDMPLVEETQFGHYHFIDLTSHGPAGDRWNLVSLLDSHSQPRESWVPFPPVYDARTTLANSQVPEAALADLGLTGEETCAEAVARFGEINPMMGF